MCNKQCSHCRWWGPVELHRNLLGVPSPSLRVFQALCLDRFRCPRCTPTAPSLFFCVCLASNTTSATCTLRDRGLLSIVLSDGDLCSVVYSCLLTVGDSSFTPLLRVSRAQVVATVQGLLGDRRIAAYCFFSRWMVNPCIFCRRQWRTLMHTPWICSIMGVIPCQGSKISFRSYFDILSLTVQSRLKSLRFWLCISITTVLCQISLSCSWC